MHSPLSEAELVELESTLLPALERHHLRLLAHGLRTLQTIAGRQDGPPPALDEIEAWALAQPAIAGDAAFARAFALQLQSSGDQLIAIGQDADCTALAVDLPTLMQWAKAQADSRVR